MRDVGRALLIAATLFLLALPSRFGSTVVSFVVATVMMFATNIALTSTFSNQSHDHPSEQPRPAVALMTAALAAMLLFAANRAWLHEMLVYPHDPMRADMLIVIQEGIRRVLRGQNPYTIYHVPWDATLPYGPVMWLPYVVPYVMRIDVRFVALIGELFIPFACALTAVASAWRRRYVPAAAALIMLAAVTTSPDVRGFSSIAHTPSYWPLLAVFAWLVAREHWWSAAIVCGLLIVARTTMVAIAPVLLMAAWQRDRRNAPIVAALLMSAAVLPYLPFAIWDPQALKYALYGSYQQLMKGFVWTSTTWAHDTVGITGLLLRARLPRLVEPVQLLAMLATFFVAWRAIRRGSRPLPWMALALFVLSATTLWPVHYIYFDVAVLWIAAAIAEGDWLRWRRVWPAWTITLAAAAASVLLIVLVDVFANPAIDVGIGATRPLLYKGFSTNEGNDRTFAWIEGTSAELLVARRSRSNAEVELEIEPYLPTAESTQQLSVALNGVILGTSVLRPGWQSVAFAAPRSAWRIGVNQLVLSLSTATSPREASDGDDTRKLSAAVDRLTVRTRS